MPFPRSPLALALVVLLGACASVPVEDRGERLMAAERALATSNWPLAAERWYVLWEEDREDLQCCAGLARALEGLGDLPSATRILEGARAVHPDHVGLAEQHASVLAARGRKLDARVALAEALSLAPGDLRLARRLGELTFASGDAEMAAPQLARAAERWVDDAELQELAAEAARQAELPELELVSLERRLALSRPRAAQFTRAADLVVRQRENVKQAEAWLVQAVAADPGDSEAWSHLGRLRLDRDARLEAKRAFREAVQVDPTDRATLLQLAQLHLQDGELERARELVAHGLATAREASVRAEFEALHAGLPTVRE